MRITETEMRWLRLRAQGLLSISGAAPSSAAQGVGALCGVQAQERPAAALALRARSTGLVEADVERARTHDRTTILTWGQRGTLHLLAAEDYGWLLPLLGPIFRAAGRRRRAELGLDDAACERAAGIIRGALAARGPLTRGELAAHLAPACIPVAGQATFHLIAYAALSGLLCCGPDRGREPTYVLLDGWARPGPALPRELALAELARRYLAAYGPATMADFAAWSGLSRGDARAAWAGIASELLPLAMEDQEIWLPKARAALLEAPAPAGPHVRLLPRFDTLLLGYRSREWLIAPEHTRRIHPGGGIIHAGVLVNGRIAGTWRTERRRAALVVTIEPFEALAAPVQAAAEAEVADIGRFLGQHAEARIVSPA